MWSRRCRWKNRGTLVANALIIRDFVIVPESRQYHIGLGRLRRAILYQKQPAGFVFFPSFFSFDFKLSFQSKEAERVGIAGCIVVAGRPLALWDDTVEFIPGVVHWVGWSIGE